MIIGHEQQKEFLGKIFDLYENGGFLLSGPEGVGKFSLIKEIAENKTAKNNLVIIKPPSSISEQTSKKFISKETTELLRNLALLYAQNIRIIIINEAHTLTGEAQNLLLKILEEIPSKTFFFFVTSRLQKILPTIRSRLQQIKFGLVNNKEIETLLLSKNNTIDKKEIKTLLEIFPGQPGLIIRIILEKAESNKSLSAFNLVLKFIKEKDKIKKMLFTEKVAKDIELDEFLKYLIILERTNLKENMKDSLLKLKNLLQLYFDSDYNLNKNLHTKNICINYY